MPLGDHDCQNGSVIVNSSKLLSELWSYMPARVTSLGWEVALTKNEEGLSTLVHP